MSKLPPLWRMLSALTGIATGLRCTPENHWRWASALMERQLRVLLDQKFYIHTTIARIRKMSFRICQEVDSGRGVSWRVLIRRQQTLIICVFLAFDLVVVLAQANLEADGIPSFIWVHSETSKFVNVECRICLFVPLYIPKPSLLLIYAVLKYGGLYRSAK